MAEVRKPPRIIINPVFLPFALYLLRVAFIKAPDRITFKPLIEVTVNAAVYTSSYYRGSSIGDDLRFLSVYFRNIINYRVTGPTIGLEPCVARKIAHANPRRSIYAPRS